MLNETVTLAQPVAIGDVVDGKYRIDEQLGAGGMGTVMAATHLVLDQRVAIKFLSLEISGSAEGMARFHREAQVSVRIKSEFVARTTDVGKLPTGTPYIVMEHLDGQDVSARLQATGPLPIAQAVEFTLQACEAVADAHALGIVHRDLKPSNLFIVRRSDGTEAIKVLDFGISKVLPGADTRGAAGSMTRTSALMGSPIYMSPEQMASARDVDGRTDIWSLGATLFEMLAGKPPFEAESLPELCSKVLTQPAPLLRERRPDAPPELEAALQQALVKDPAQRYGTIASFSAGIAPFAPESAKPTAERISRILMAAGMAERTASSFGKPASPLTPATTNSQTAPDAAPAPQAPTGPSPDGSSSVGTMASWSQTSRRPTDRRWALVATGIAAVGLLSAGVWWLASNRSRTAESAVSKSATAEPTTSSTPPEQTVAKVDPEPTAAPGPSASSETNAEQVVDEPPVPQPVAPLPVATAKPTTTSKPGSSEVPATRHGGRPSSTGELPSDRVGTTQSKPASTGGDNLMMDRH